MAIVIADRVKETSNTTGTGTFVLAGASTGFQSFAVIGDGNTTYYTIQNPGTNEWEVGIGTYYSANTSIVRTTVFSSSNANSVVSFSSGTKDVFVTYPSENAVTTLIANTFTNNQVISVNSSSNALTITQTGAGNALVVEDSANPDATPFVVDASGNVGIGGSPIAATTSLTTWTDTAAWNNIQVGKSVDATNAPTFIFNKSRGTRASPVIVNADDNVGVITPSAYDGSTYRGVAQIAVAVDGTPGLTDTPGRIIFTTRPAGAGASLTERMRINSAGAVGIGTSGLTGVNLAVGKNITGSITGYGVRSTGQIQTDVTSQARMFDSSVSLASGSFTLTTLYHYYTSQGSIGGATVTNQIGYLAESTLTGATNNYGFYSDIASGTGRWNFYANGTAKNLFAGQTSIGGLEGAESLRVGPVASAVNRIEAFGATTGNPPYIFANGSDTNVNLTIYSKGASGIFLDTNVSTATAFGVELGASTTVNRDTYIDFHSSSGTDYDFRIIRNSGVNNSANFINGGSGGIAFQTNSGTSQFNIIHTASAVNYLQVTGATTGNNPWLAANGSDTNIGIRMSTKGSGSIVFQTGGSSEVTQFNVAHTASAVNYVQATGSATGNAVAISAQGTDANVSISIAAKGSGNVTVSGDLTANLTTTVSGPFDSGTGATWTNPRTRATWAKIELWGGGGGGGGTNSGGAGGGGGGGAYFTVTVPFSYLGTTETYTVGAGGANVSTATSGGNGGNTTFTVSNWPGGSKTFTVYGGGGGGGAASTGGYAGGGGGGSLGVGGNGGVNASTASQGGQPTSGTQTAGNGNEGFGGAASGAGSNLNGGNAAYGGGGGGAGDEGAGTGVTGLGGSSIYGGGGGGGANDAGTVRNAGGTSIFGGKGGDGGYGNNTTAAQNGTVPGGGGGGSDLGTAGSGNGASGRVLITIW